MSQIHVLDASGPTVRVVAHIAIPVGNNLVGVPWNVALINSGIGGTTVLKDGDGTKGTISAAEKAQIVSGTIFEVSGSVTPAGLTGQALLDMLDAKFLSMTADVLANFQARLNYFGAVR